MGTVVADFTETITSQEFKGLGLKREELAFVHYFIACRGDAQMAAVKAGYNANHGYVLTKKLIILEAIRRYVLMEFQTDAVIAKSVLVDVMVDVRTPPTVKRQCAVDILNIANLAGGTLMPPGEEKAMMDLSNLTESEKDELERLLEKTCKDPAKTNVIDVDFIKERNDGEE